MPQSYFQFKQFIIHQQHAAMKVCTDSCLFGSLLPVHEIKTVLDIGTGTGLLALLYAQLNKQAMITALEIDAAACLQAKENAEQSKFHRQINVLHTSLGNFVSEPVFDLLICNPPFYKNNLKSSNPARNTAMHEASLDLEYLLQKGRTLLAPRGKFYVLIPFARAAEMELLLQQNDFYVLEKIQIKQTTRHPYFRVVYGFGLKKGTIHTRSIAIKENEQYTDGFIQLLKDFYLYL